MTNLPPPGSPEAVAAGCTCLFNHWMDGETQKRAFHLRDAQCREHGYPVPQHGRAIPKPEMESDDE